MRTQRENGIALITALMVLFLISALVVGMSWMVMTDQRLGGNNSTRETAFYGAEAGMEKMTADMGNIFATQGSLTGANIATVEGEPPVIPGVTYQNALGSTYQITCTGCPGNPVSQNATILPPSPYAGMNGLVTPFTLTVAAQDATGSEVKLQRSVQVVAIPVFQFGIFSQTDLAFFAGPPFDFGGRVHTNGNLWLAANSGPLYLRDKVTVSGQVIRTNLENGVAVNSGSYGGIVTIADPAELPATPTDYPPSPSYTNSQWRALGLNEGSISGNSVYGNISTTLNNPTWSNTVEPAYQGMLTNNVQPLNLVATALGGLSSPINIIRRPLISEQTSNPAQFAERQFSQASLRILLDDYGTDGTCGTADMLQLNTVTSTTPIDLKSLDTLTAPSWWTGSTETFYPLPTGYGSSYSSTNGYWFSASTSVITGCLKVEYQNSTGTWTDVTEEILREGFIGRNIYPQAACSGHGCTNTVAPTLVALPSSGTAVGPQGPPNSGDVGCSDPNPNAIIRIARVRDNPANATSGGCGSITKTYDTWPNVLYDTRESISRDTALGNDTSNANSNPYITAAGVMYYVELDVNNLARWFTGAIGSSGTNALNTGGYSVYFSDRRGNEIDPTSGYGIKTGSFGFNDIVNPSNPTTGCPNTTLDSGEDLESDGNLRTYGEVPISTTQSTSDEPPVPTFISGFVATTNLTTSTANGTCGTVTGGPSPTYVYKYTQEARENTPMFFRRALKLVDGTSFSLGTACYGASPNPPCGLTIAAENPVYIQGDYNAPNNGTWSPVGVAASVMADAVTMLSDSWNDVNSFISPYNLSGRPGNTTAYRVAVIGGKGIPFPQVTGTAADYGTDGGLHNFLRYLENWSGTLYYKGSLVSFYYNRQAVGLYKCCNTVYNPPSRGYSFDGDFSQGPQWLPPRTPTLRSINTVGFTQEILPTQ